MTTGTCTACLLIDKDSSQKEVTECKKCGAWLCGPCAKNPARRVKAAAIKAYRNLK